MKGEESRIEWWGKRLILALYLPLFGHFLWVLSAQLAHDHEAQDRATRYAATSPHRIAQECPGRELGAIDARCAEEAKEPSNERQRREREVRAEEQTAAWTSYAVEVALFGLLVSIGGILLLLRSLRHGQEELAHTREIDELRTRPMMAPDGYEEGTWAYGLPTFFFKWKNVGSLPAQILSGEFHIVDYDIGPIEPWVDDAPKRKPNRIDKPGAIVPVGDPHVSTRALVEKETREFSAHIYGKLTYKSAVAPKGPKAKVWVSEVWGTLSRFEAGREPGDLVLVFERTPNGVRMT